MLSMDRGTILKLWNDLMGLVDIEGRTLEQEKVEHEREKIQNLWWNLTKQKNPQPENAEALDLEKEKRSQPDNTEIAKQHEIDNELGNGNNKQTIRFE